MSELVITEAGSQPMAGHFDVVALRVNGRVAGPVVVARGLGEPLARLLSSGPIVAAARAVTELYSSPPPGMTFADVEAVLAELVRAVATVDAEPVGTGRPVVEPPSDRRLLTAQPDKLLVEAGNRLMYGNTEGVQAGDPSVFRAVAVAGTVDVMTPFGRVPKAFGVVLGNAEATNALGVLAEQLGEMADDITESGAAYDAAFGPKPESAPSS